jgi:hypothetical protein
MFSPSNKVHLWLPHNDKYNSYQQNNNNTYQVDIQYTYIVGKYKIYLYELEKQAE